MNSRYKFRAFDKETNLMIYDVQDAYDGLSCDSNSYDVNEEYAHVCCFSSFIDRENFVLMQCTGLKDENGVDIYEGDILRAGFLVDDSFMCDSGVVAFKNGSFVVEHDELEDDSLVDFVQGANLKVVGNIYENRSDHTC